MDINLATQPKGVWQIGLAKGNRLQDLQSDLSDSPLFEIGELSRFNGCAAADPFGIYRDGTWYVFFEMFLCDDPHAVIGVASSRDLIGWSVLGVALRQPHHLSFPYVFEHDGDIFMMPESKKVRRVDLYRAYDFPFDWRLEKTVLRGRYMDASIVANRGRYWLFSGWHSYWLRLFYSHSPLGPWKRHWQPFARMYNKKDVRPGGRIVSIDGQLVRLAQDNQRYYGHQLRAMQIKTLNRLSFSETPYQPLPVLCPDNVHWRNVGMHHLDLHAMDEGYIGFVDGFC
ncbi:MAG: hypothetical protein ACK5OC_22420 [Pirellula sp.]